MTPLECKKVEAILMSDNASRNTWASWVLKLYEHWRSERNGACGILLCSLVFDGTLYQKNCSETCLLR